jgi:hypothetical protein
MTTTRPACTVARFALGLGRGPAFLAPLAACFLLLGPQTLQSDRRCTLRWELPHETIVGLPIVGAFVIENMSRVTINVDVGSWDRLSGLVFELSDPDGGRTIGRPTPPPFGGLHTGGKFDVQPGQTVRESFVVDQWVPIPRPGTFALTVTIDGTFAPSTQVDIQRQVSTAVIVHDRNEEAIRVRCRELLAQVQSRNERRFAAALELAFVRDPVAVPYLLNALQTQGVPGTFQMIEAMVRIGGTPAREALVVLTGSSDASIAAWARDGLRRIR